MEKLQNGFKTSFAEVHNRYMCGRNSACLAGQLNMWQVQSEGTAVLLHHASRFYFSVNRRSGQLCSFNFQRKGEKNTPLPTTTSLPLPPPPKKQNQKKPPHQPKPLNKSVTTGFFYPLVPGKCAEWDDLTWLSHEGTQSERSAARMLCGFSPPHWTKRVRVCSVIGDTFKSRKWKSWVGNSSKKAFLCSWLVSFKSMLCLWTPLCCFLCPALGQLFQRPG